MKTRTLVFSVVGLLMIMAVIFSGCGMTTPTPSEAAALEGAPEGAMPEDTVKDFYRWYTHYNGNVMVDGVYRDSAYLMPEVVQKVDDILASFTHGGYDPFLCAQDIPQAFEVGRAVVDGDEATVTAHGIWNPDTEYVNRNDILVKLVKVDGVWKISDLSCPR